AWHADLRPDALALIADGQTVTWAELADSVDRRARAFVAHDVRPDDRVAVQLPNGRTFIETMFATWAAGATPMPLSPQLTAAERGRLLDLAHPKLLVTEEWAAKKSGPRPDAPP